MDTELQHEAIEKAYSVLGAWGDYSHKSNEELLEFADKLWWGTADGRFLKISEMSLMHIRNVLITQDRLNDLLKAVMIARLMELANVGLLVEKSAEELSE